VFCGIDAFVLPALELGIAGCIVGAANFLARPLADLLRAWNESDHTPATAQWAGLVPGLLAILDQERFSFQAGVKAATRLTGLDLGERRPPLTPVAPDDVLEIQQALEQIPGLDLGVAATTEHR
jgi:dihydrodipicolinate synthase/N-acetylneuraminate lyase